LLFVTLTRMSSFVSGTSTEVNTSNDVQVVGQVYMERRWLETLAELEQLKRNSERELRAVAEGYSKGYSQQHQRIRHAERHVALRNQRIAELQSEVDKYRTKIHVLRTQIKSLSKLVEIPRVSNEKGNSSEDVMDTGKEQSAGDNDGRTMHAIRQAIGTLARLGEDNNELPELSILSEPLDAAVETIPVHFIPQITPEDDKKLRVLFAHADKNGDGIINVREMLIGLRKDSELANILHLPRHIRQENGTRDAFESVFQDMIHHGEKREVTYEEFRQYIMEHKSKDSLVMVPPSDAPPPTGVASIIGIRNSSAQHVQTEIKQTPITTSSLSPPFPSTTTTSAAATTTTTTTTGAGTPREAHIAAAAAAAAVAQERETQREHFLKKEQKLREKLQRDATMSLAAAIAQQKQIGHTKVLKAEERVRHDATLNMAAAVAQQRRIDRDRAQKMLERKLHKTKHDSAILSAAQLASVIAQHKAVGVTLEANAAAEVAEEVEAITQGLELKMMMDNEEKLELERQLKEKVDALNEKIEDEQKIKASREKELAGKIAALQNDLRAAQNESDERLKDVAKWEQNMSTHMQRAQDLEMKLETAETKRTSVEKTSADNILKMTAQLQDAEAKRSSMEKTSAENILQMEAQLRNTQVELKDSETNYSNKVLKGMNISLLKWLKKRQHQAFTTWWNKIIEMRRSDLEQKTRNLKKATEEKEMVNHVMRVTLERAQERITSLNEEIKNIQDSHNEMITDLKAEIKNSHMTHTQIIEDIHEQHKQTLVDQRSTIENEHKELLAMEKRKLDTIWGNEVKETEGKLAVVQTAVHSLEVALQESEKDMKKQRDQHTTDTKELHSLLSSQAQALSTANSTAETLREEAIKKQKELAAAMAKNLTLHKQVLDAATSSKTASTSMVVDSTEMKKLQARVKELERNNRKGNMRIGALDKQLKVFREQAKKQQVKAKAERDKNKAAARAAAKKRKADKEAKKG
jgi:hypothetical protein